MTEQEVKRIRELESNINKNVQNTNDIVELLKYLNDDIHSPELVTSAIQSLRRVFTKIIDKNYLRPKYMNASVQLNEAVEKYRQWLLKRYEYFQNAVVDLIDNENEVCQITAFRTIMSFCQKGDYKEKEAKPTFDFVLCMHIMSKLLSFETLPQQLVLCLKDEYFQYTDMKYFTISSLHGVLLTKVKKESKKNKKTEEDVNDFAEVNDMTMEDIIKRILYILSLMETPVDEEVTVLGIFKEKYKQINQQRKNYSTLIQLILSQDLTVSLIEYILMKLNTEILPYLDQPVFLADFLTDCYNYGDSLSVMSLGGLYELITRYNVNYPAYYDKLYSLLTEKVFNMKHRQRFLSLLVKSLRSTAVPAIVIAAFCKRLSRIAIMSSPSTALFVIPLLTELLSYHHSLYELIQVEDKECVYDVVSVRKVLPGLEEDEVKKIKKNEDLVEEDDDNDEDDDDDDDEDDEVQAEVDDHKMMERSTAVLSSDILKRTLARMELKRKRNEKELEVPEKLPKIEYNMKNMKEIIRNKSAFDVFDNTTNDIQSSHALESYLWELYILLHHYDPNVVIMMKLLQNKLLKTRQQFNNIVNITYESEFNRLIKTKPENYATASHNAGYMNEESTTMKLFS